jgi:hypothetical protein
MHIISKAFTRGLLPDLFKEDVPDLFRPGFLSGCRLNRWFKGGLSFGGIAIVLNYRVLALFFLKLQNP